MATLVRKYRKYKSEDSGQTWIATDEYKYEDVGVDACGCNTYTEFTNDTATSEYLLDIDKSNSRIRKIIIGTCASGITFINNTSIVKLKVPSNITSINYIQNNNSLSSLTLSSGVTSINYISNNPSLTSLVIPDSVTTIGHISNNSGLTSLTIGKNVTVLGDESCYNNRSLQYVDIQGAQTINGTAFRATNALTTVVFGNFVRDIGDSAFSEKTNLTSVTFSHYITSIGSNCFSGCTSLTELDIPINGVIKEKAFARCTSLSSVTIGPGVTSIQKNCFSGDTNLTDVTILGGVVNEYAFSGVSSITSLTIGENVTEIHGPFYGNRFTTLHIPNARVEGAFAGCNSLTSVTLDYSAIAGDSAFVNCSNLVSATVNGGDIGEFAFGAYDDIPCSLSSLTLGNAVTSLGGYFIRNQSLLKNLTIPTSLNHIYSNAFYHSSLTDIYYNGTLAQWNLIQKDTDWDTGATSGCYLHCTDGDRQLW